ncbi:N-acetylglutamate synthase [Nadsonia fulvescens var. elongata DSM 6958]|uniref:Amino-acid acetyltransferase, mitochondrial n=1 Tax=Nadsonia fulvescens var. elongata DSM 6958 TaxID=857566 RepID=A0A1E3PKR2_9ASCO|nr:N-acetylglutamate synthase [Nadsonia fulvescens var. elongata DSM 6958]
MISYRCRKLVAPLCFKKYLYNVSQNPLKSSCSVPRLSLGATRFYTSHESFSSLSSANRESKDLILSVLRSTATKREAKQYLSKYTPLTLSSEKELHIKRQEFWDRLLNAQPGNKTVDSVLTTAPKIDSISTATATSNDIIPLSTLRIALIKIRDIKSISHNQLTQIGSTFGRLSKLGVSPLVVIDAGRERNDYLNEDNKPFRHYQKLIQQKASLVCSVIENASLESSSSGNSNSRPRESDSSGSSSNSPRNAESNSANSPDSSSGSFSPQPLSPSSLPTIRARPIGGLFDINHDEITPQDEHINETKLKFADGSSCHSSNYLKFSVPELLLMPLAKGTIPVLIPLAYDSKTNKERLINADDVILFLSRQLSRLPSDIVSVEKIIFIDPLGGIPSIERSMGAHVFVNLQQEFDDINSELHIGFISPTEREIHLSNLITMRETLKKLPNSASGIITTPLVASLNSTRNPIIYNVLTDRPVISPSLPVSMKKTPTQVTTLIRYGIPVQILQSSSPHAGIDLIKEHNAGRVDLNKLWRLIDDSFGKTLNREEYLKRINKKVAAVIIAGDYEGAAIITWESFNPCHEENDANGQPGAGAFLIGGRNPGTPDRPIVMSMRSLSLDDPVGDTDEASEGNDGIYVPKKYAYLDKFAVQRKSQGANGVADIIFKIMTIQIFPDELIWRSRTANIVNKWYFDRSKGSVKINDSQWTLFWTGKKTNVWDKRGKTDKEKASRRLKDYIGICRQIEPSFSQSQSD